MATAAPIPLPGNSASSRRSLVVATVLLTIITGIFWIDSRYPALYKKLHQGAAVQVKGSITFDKVLLVDKSMPLRTRVARTTVNWLAANRVGMTFGFLFGAGALTLLPGLRRPRSSNRYKNVLWGTLTGVPLGVCSNCVAPIAQGLYASGAASESALATMLSSPTLNIVVLAMVFSLFPLPIALVKVGLTFLVLLLVLPRTSASYCSSAVLGDKGPLTEATNWGKAFTSTLASFAKNLWYLLRTAAPLMFLAAALGALVIELVPREALATTVSPLKIILVSVVGTFLPVPMAFDVFAAYVAMRSGVPLPYVVSLLCTLGAYSVYSFFITGKAIAWKTALSIFAAIALCGALAGLGTAALLS